jgi:creatinine amidohydrolase
VTSTPWILSRATWPDVRDTDWQVAVLPWGATEPHNLHLPYGTDVTEATAVAHEAARIAWEEGAAVTVLPAVPFGVQTTQLDLTFALNMNPSTQAAVLADLAESLDHQGVPRLVIVNGHGGNDFKPIIRELQPHVDVFLSAVSWYHVADQDAYFDDPGDHGGELETSVMMHLVPDRVRPLDEAGPGTAREWRIPGMRDGWAWAPRPWSRLTDDTGVGNPAAATAEKGARYFDVVTRRLGQFLVDLSATDPEDLLG